MILNIRDKNYCFFLSVKGKKPVSYHTLIKREKEHKSPSSQILQNY